MHLTPKHVVKCGGNSSSFMVVLVICMNEEDPSKMKMLEWSQHFSNCKSMEIFSDAQRQITTSNLVDVQTQRQLAMSNLVDI